MMRWFWVQVISLTLLVAGHTPAWSASTDGVIRLQAKELYVAGRHVGDRLTLVNIDLGRHNVIDTPAGTARQLASRDGYVKGDWLIVGNRKPRVLLKFERGPYLLNFALAQTWPDEDARCAFPYLEFQFCRVQRHGASLMATLQQRVPFGREPITEAHSRQRGDREPEGLRSDLSRAFGEPLGPNFRIASELRLMNTDQPLHVGGWCWGSAGGEFVNKPVSLQTQEGRVEVGRNGETRFSGVLLPVDVTREDLPAIKTARAAAPRSSRTRAMRVVNVENALNHPESPFRRVLDSLGE